MPYTPTSWTNGIFAASSLTNLENGVSDAVGRLDTQNLSIEEYVIPTNTQAVGTLTGSGPYTLTLTYGSFPASLTGVNLYIDGAGASGSFLKVTAATRTSASVATFTTPAPTTLVTGALVVAGVNNYTPIKNAFTDAFNERIQVFTTSPGGSLEYRAAAKRPVSIPTGIYIIETSALIDSPRASSASSDKIWNGAVIQGSNSLVGTDIMVATTDSSVTVPNLGNVFTLDNMGSGHRYQNLNFRSMNPNSSAWYLYANKTGPSATYPTLSWGGVQNDYLWENINLIGSWNRGWGLDGAEDGNQNSEMTWRNVRVRGTFADSVWRIGITNTATNTGMDQSVNNYIEQSCKIEINDGHVLRLERGQMRFAAQDVVMALSSTGSGVAFLLGPHNDDGTYTGVAISQDKGTRNFECLGTRFEMRKAAAKVFDIAWDGTNSRAVFRGISTLTNQQAVQPTKQWRMGTLRRPGQFVMEESSVNGYVLYDMGPGVWESGQVITAASVQRTYNGNLYSSTGAGTTGATPPTHGSGAVTDGGVSWTYVSAFTGTPWRNRQGRMLFRGTTFVDWPGISDDLIITSILRSGNHCLATIERTPSETSQSGSTPVFIRGLVGSAAVFNSATPASATWSFTAWSTQTVAAGVYRTNAGNIYVCTTGGNSITAPTGTTTFTDGNGVAWLYLGATGTKVAFAQTGTDVTSVTVPSQTRAVSTAYAVGDLIRSTSQTFYRATVAGTTSATATTSLPFASTIGIGETLVDGGVTWQVVPASHGSHIHAAFQSKTTDTAIIADTLLQPYGPLRYTSTNYPPAFEVRGCPGYSDQIGQGGSITLI
jgi:hypothetical protein